MGRRPIRPMGIDGRGEGRCRAPEGRLARLETLLAERANACETAVIAADAEGRMVEAVAGEILRRLDAAKPGHGSDVEKGVRV